MKHILLALLCLNALGYSHKKGALVIGDKKKPEVSAILEVASTVKGFLPPRMTQVQRDAIVSPSAGLEIYNIDTNTPEFYNGVTWVQSGGTGTSFQITSVGHGRAIGCPLSPVYFDGTNWVDAAANATATLATHVITKVVDADTLEISQSGRFSCNAHGLTSGLHYYTGNTGGLSTTPADSFNNPVLLVENSNTVHIMPYRASTTASVTVGQVDTVFGRTGNIIAVDGDYTASNITSVPNGSLISVDVQSAIDELDSNIQAIDLSSFVPNSTLISVGEGLIGGGDLTSDRAIGLNVDGLTSQPIALSDTLVFFDGTNHRKTTLSDIFTQYMADIDSIANVDTTGKVIGSILEYNGTNWVVGSKTVDTDSQVASEVAYTPFSFYASTNTQDIVEEVEASIRADLANKAEASRNIIAGTHLVGGGDLTSDKTLSVDPTTIDITTLDNFNANSFIDMSTINIDVSDVNDGIQGFNTTLDSDVSLAIDIPSLSLESPARVSTELMGFSFSTNKLVRVGVQDIADTAAAAVVAPIDEVNGQTGIVNLDTDDIPVTATNVYVTPSEKTQITTNAGNIATNTSDIATNISNISNNTSGLAVAVSDISDNASDIATNVANIASNASSIAAISTVGFSNDYNDLDNLPTLGDVAATSISDYATAAQGVLASSALQSGDNVSELVNDSGYITAAAIPINSVNGQTGSVVLDADDIDDSSTTHKFASVAQLNQIATNSSDISTNTTDIASNVLSINGNASGISANSVSIGGLDTRLSTAESDITSNDSDISTLFGTTISLSSDISTNTSNITTNANDIAALAAVASSGDYADLVNLPTLGTAADNAETDFATAAQGVLADSALQSGDNVSELVNDANYITSTGAPVQSVNTQTGVVVLDADDIDDTSTTHKFATATELSQIVVNQGDIASNATDIGTNASAINTNTTNISSNDIDIAANATDISTNTADIATNVTNISSNDVDIAANASAIAALTTDDVAEGSNLYFTDTRARDAVVVNNTTSIATDQAMSAAGVQDLVAESIYQASNTNTTTNLSLNTGQFTTVIPLFGTINTINSSTSFSPVVNGVEVLFDGFVEISSNVHIFSTGQRSGLQMRLRKNAVPEGPIGSTGYIRAVTGHNESSLHISNYYMAVSTGDVISVGIRRESTNTTATTLSAAGSSSISIRRVK